MLNDFKMAIAKTFLLLIISEFTITYCQVQSNRSTEVETKNWCYMNSNSESKGKCPDNDDPIEVNFKPGSKKGSVIAKFLLAPPHCMQPEYEITLLYDNGGDDSKNCNKISSEVPHSLKIFKILSCNNDNCMGHCGKYGSVYFYNVESGCYKAAIKQRSRNFKNRLTNWTYIESGDSEEWDTKIDIQDLFPFSHGVNVSMTFSKPTSDVMIDLISEKNLKKMNITMLSEDEKCHFLKSKKSSENITKYDALSCTFSSLSEEYKRIIVYAFKDEQCGYEKKKIEEPEPCWKMQRREISYDKATVITEGNWILPIIILCSLLSVLILGVMILVLFIKRRNPRKAPSTGESALLDPEVIDNDFEVLLLYTKDCKEFMVTMESFRQMLGELCNVKVYDCFDEPNWEDEQISPHDWLEKTIKFKPCLHIVLVSTLCACIQKQRFLSGEWNANISAFKNPSCLDNIFLYGLQIVKHYEISNLAYGKIYIIQLNGFSDDANAKELTTLSRIYQIPLHLNQLVADMKNASFKKYLDEDDLKRKHLKIVSIEEDFDELSDLTRFKSYIKFLNHLQNLRDFKMNNQNYLEEMLQPIILNLNSNGKIGV